MSKCINEAVSRLPTFEIYARFAPGTLEPIHAIRKQYAANQIYPRDVGVRLFRDIFKNAHSTTLMQSKLSYLASIVAPFEVPIHKPFRNSPLESKAYPPAVYYQLSKVPLTYIASHITYLVKDLHKRDYRSNVAKSFKIGVSGQLADHAAAARIVEELSSIEPPPPIHFDAFVLATRTNLESQAELDGDADLVFPFMATQKEFKTFWEHIQIRRRQYHSERARERGLIEEPNA
ncbi:hypothetical protein K3495_g7317 [Podosphaera aphanis]|nr:hypothetical protein K3495_g7317 [Podosphaera aphanis]